MRPSIPSAQATALVDVLSRFDGLKRIQRSDYVGGTNRLENPAEHTWHALLVLMAYRQMTGDETIDYTKAYELLIVHDLPEIVAGDTPIFDEIGSATALERERAGLAQLTANAEPAFAAKISELWEEFEALSTPEARLAKVCDRFQGSLQNLSSQGRGWVEHHVTLDQIENITAIVRQHSPFFSALLTAVLATAERGGFLPPRVQEG